MSSAVGNLTCRFAVLLAVLLAVLVVGAACSREPPAGRSPAAAPSELRAAPDAAGPPATVWDAAAMADEVPGDAGQVGDAGDGDGGMAEAGDWVSAGMYAIRLQNFKPCPSPSQAAAGRNSVAMAAAADAGTAGAAGGATVTGGATVDGVKSTWKQKSWVAALVEVKSGTDEFFVSPRDASLERDGIILQPRYLDSPPLIPGCAPLMAQKQLRPKQRLRGYLLFEIPVSFRNGRGPIVLAYKPTRWGGARRAEIRIPPCFDACPEGGAGSGPGLPGRQRKKR